MSSGQILQVLQFQKKYFLNDDCIYMNDGIEICSKVQDREGDRYKMKAEMLTIFILTLKPKRKVDVSERMSPEN